LLTLCRQHTIIQGGSSAIAFSFAPAAAFSISSEYIDV
jgi:hypothetical protein